MPERDVENDRQRYQHDEHFEGAEPCERHHQHRAEHAAEVGDPQASEVFLPDRQHRQPPLERHGNGDDAAVQDEVDSAKQAEEGK